MNKKKVYKYHSYHPFKFNSYLEIRDIRRVREAIVKVSIRES